MVATSVMAVKATPKAMKLIEQAKEEKREELTKWEITKVAAPTYIPAVSIAIATVTCIFGANIINKRHQATLMSAYALLDQTHKEYKRKVVTLYGEDADKRVNEELAKDTYNNSDISVEENKQLFYDMYSKRYFNSTIEEVQRAEYYLNRNLHRDECATLNDFYKLLGIDTIDVGDKLGWSLCMNFEAYWQTWVDFTHEKAVMEDGLECYIISIQTEPIMDFEDYY